MLSLLRGASASASASARAGAAVAALTAVLALSGAGAAAAATGAPGTDPTITIRVGGVRTAENGPPGPPAAAGLGGVTYRATAAGFTPVSCVSDPAGRCTLNVASGKTYTITQAGLPAGWYASPTLAAGSGGNNTARGYAALSVPVGTASVTIPAAAANSDT